jgi:CRP-like cAMP-binding protein
MALKDDIKLLSSVPLFSGLSLDQLRLIAFGAERAFVPEGDILFQAGDSADCAYLVASGRIILTTQNRSGEQIVVTSASAGTLLSELAMISQVDRKYLATAKQNTELLRISRNLFMRLLEEYPEVAVIMEERISANFLEMTSSLAAIKGRFA